MYYDYLKISLELERAGEIILLSNDCLDVLKGDYDGKYVAMSILYDYSDVPLKLCGEAKSGDGLRLMIRPERVELWINDELVDEEWPCGRHYLSDFVNKAVLQYKIETFIPMVKPSPAVIGEFTQAEGWRPESNVFVGDCMPYAHDGRYHVLYLKDRHHHRSKWGLGAHQWSHISTNDFINWQIHPMAVEIESPDEGSICTGSWIKCGDMQYLFYTVRTCDRSPAPLRRSVSTDGYHFKRDEGFEFKLSDRYTGASARDPKVVSESDGIYHMFVTTSLRADGKGCLAHLVSTDLNIWNELDPIYISPTDDEPECSDYITLNGWHYLIFSLRSRGQYLYSKNPFSDWITPHDSMIPCKSVPKATIWNDEIVFAGFDGHGNYAGTMTFIKARQDPNGELLFEGMQA